MKKTKIFYWIFTGLFGAMMLASAIPDILVQPMAVNGFKEIGMPASMVPFLGWAKLLGVIAILVPGFPRIKEWAYAGLVFDLLGATYLVAASGKPLAYWIPMVIMLGIAAASYTFYHKKRKAASYDKLEGTQKAGISSSFKGNSMTAQNFPVQG